MCLALESHFRITAWIGLRLMADLARANTECCVLLRPLPIGLDELTFVGPGCIGLPDRIHEWSFRENQIIADRNFDFVEACATGRHVRGMGSLLAAFIASFPLAKPPIGRLPRLFVVPGRFG